MDVIIHQHISMNSHAMRLGRLCQQLNVVNPVGITMKAGLSIISTLYQVVRTARGI
jgi:hypothetical protein